MGHGHGHSHGHGAHGSAAASGGHVRAIAVVLGFTTLYMVAEVVGGLLTKSLALLADAGHMLSDSSSLALALFAFWLARRPATPNRSFGFKRAEIFAALVNGLTLVLVALWIFYEAAERFRDPPEVLGGWMLVVAVGGLAVNLAGALVLSRSDRSNLNLEAALRHVVADLLGSVGVIVAAIVILVSGWFYADPLISVVIGLLVMASSWGVIRDSISVLLEESPRGVDANAVATSISEAPGVVGVHDLHIWTITSGFPALSAHVLVEQGDDCHLRRRELEAMLDERYGIEHTTLQVDHAAEQLLELRRF